MKRRMIVSTSHCAITDNMLDTFANNAMLTVGGSNALLVKDIDNSVGNSCAAGYTSLTTTETNTGANYYNAVNGITQAWLTNSGNGYLAKFSFVPATTHPDISGINPQFAEVTTARRSITLWPTRYLNTTPTRGAWATSTSYSVGDTVTDSSAAVWSGQPVMYRCILAHTSAAGNEPGKGGLVPGGTSAWRTYWEFAVWQYLRQNVPANTQITDGAIPECPLDCSVNLAIMNWVRRGYTPQNYAMYLKGTDGTTPGAVEMDLPHRLR